MPGILPEAIAGGLVYRQQDGLPTPPPNVQNAYPPLPEFLANCGLTALPSDCTARIEPRQINAIVSELLSFAECMDPNGPWDCTSLQNLCTAFTTWVSVHIIPAVIVSPTPPPNPAKDQLWWESDSAYMFIWYDDGSTKQWVQVASSAGAPGDGGASAIVDGSSIVGAGIVGDPFTVNIIDCGVW